MKYLSLILLSLGVFTSSAQDFKEKKVASEITDVTVFLEGAQVTRKSTTNLSTGYYELILDKLSPYINQNSIQVKGLGDFTVLSVNYNIDYLRNLQKDHKTDSLVTLSEGLEKKLSEKRARLEVLAQKERLLSVNNDLNGKETQLSLILLKQAIDFYDKELTKISNEKIKTNIQIKELTYELGKVRAELSEVALLREEPQGEIHIRVQAKQYIKAGLTVSYLVREAGWFPKYDIRLDNIEKPITLNYKADVYQNTGVDWDRVKLKFSNGNPNQSSTAPELSTWRLNYHRANRGQVRRRSSVNEMDDNIEFDQLEEVVVGYGVSSSQARHKSKKASAPVRKLEAKKMTATTYENQTTVEFGVDKPYSIKSKGAQLTVDLKEYGIPAVYEYYATPKLDKDAFLIARLVDWDQYNLLQGEANLYFEDNYVGRSVLDVQSWSDTLDISMGRDKNIVINRERVEEFTKKRTVGANKVESRKFKTSIRNKKTQSIKLTLFDQIPIAAISSIMVEPNKVSGQLEESSGTIKWNLEIPASSSAEVEFGYEVKYPKRERVILE